MRLPESVEEIAAVIGRQRALYLIGKLPRYYDAVNQNDRVMLYVPKQLTVTHSLVQILGWQDAQRMVDAFGGEILKPANCSHIYRAFRDRHIIRLVGEGLPAQVVAEWFDVCARHVRNIARDVMPKEKPQVAQKAANDNNQAVINHKKKKRR